MPAVLGHSAWKNEKIDQMKSDGQPSKIYGAVVMFIERSAKLPESEEPERIATAVPEFTVFLWTC